MLVDFGYAILDSLENEVSEMDNSVMGSGGRAALSAIPSALKRWNEESCVIDGDSMHNCVTALKPTILEVSLFSVIVGCIKVALNYCWGRRNRNGIQPPAIIKG